MITLDELDFIYNRRKIEFGEVYRFSRNRTGTYIKENKKFIEKYKIEKLIEVLNSHDIPYEFDAMTNSSKCEVTITGCNYGALVFSVNPFFDIFLYSKFIENNKVLPKNFDIDLNLEDRINKYHSFDDTFDKTIENLIIISSIAKHSILDWKLINNLMYKKNSYLKFHPILDYETRLFLVSKYSVSKIINSYYILDLLIEKSNTIALSGCSESIITTSLLNKNIIFLNKPVLRIRNVLLSYYVFYKSIYNGYNIRDVVNTGATGLIPWKYLNDTSFLDNYLKFFKKNHYDWKNSSNSHTN